MIRSARLAVSGAALAALLLVGVGCSKSEPASTTTTTAPSTTASSTTAAGSGGSSGTAAGGAVSKADFEAALEDTGLGPDVAACIIAEFDQNELAYPPASGGNDEQEQLLDEATNTCVQDVIDASGNVENP